MAIYKQYYKFLKINQMKLCKIFADIFNNCYNTCVS